MLTTDLSRSGELEVIATQRLFDLAAMAGGEDRTDMDQATVTELARWAGAGLVISGSVFKLGEVYRIDAQAYDTSSGTVSLARKVEGTDLFSLVNDLASGLRQGLQLEADQVAGDMDLVATTSEDALRYYTQAKEHYGNLRFDEAAERLERSLETDPEFGLARLGLAMSRHAMGDEEGTAECVEELGPTIDRLPEADRLLARALRAFVSERDFEAGTRYLEELTEKYPNNGAAYVLWARGLDELAANPLRATRKLQMALKHDPNNLPAIVALAEQLERLGAEADAKEILRQAAKRNPEAAIP
jgi:tetratricopeptide (TPR) repeat protein